MERFLSKEGYVVTVASNGDQGLALARSLKPAVITLDILMPGRDGWSVLSALKADKALADIPVILVTITDDQNMGFTLGASDFLSKPIEWDRLATILNKYRQGAAAQFALVVEDDPAARDMLQRNLERHGWEVAVAENGRVALERIAKRAPSVILLDLMMPEMDGFEFVRELRQRESGRHIPVIVITAKELTDEDRKRLNGHVVQILKKGKFNTEELLRELRGVLESIR